MSPRGVHLRLVCPGGFKFGVSAPWPMTTFYPFRPSECREPDSMFAIWRTEKHLGGQPHLISGAIRHPAPLSGGPHQVKPINEDVTSSTLSRLEMLLSDCGMRFQFSPLRQHASFQESPQLDQ
jgi:hypothetical protein